MFRKLIIALGATAALTATAGSAFAWHPHHHNHGYGYGAFGAGVALGALATPVVAGYPYGYASNCYVVKRWVDTSYGPRLRRVTVCD